MPSNTSDHQLCRCGCGKPAPLAKHTNQRTGVRKGQPLPFIHGHWGRIANRWEERDTGYETPCWIWLLASFRERNGKNYGLVQVNGKSRRAHRHYWELQHGPIPTGLHLHHRCEQTLCVRPDHLRLLTPAEHMRHHQATVDREAVREARRRGEQPMETQRRMGISGSSYRRAINEEPALKEITVSRGRHVT